MKVQQELTAQEVVIAARTALQNHTLGGEFSKNCMYDYGDGTHCAVGAALEQDTLDEIAWGKDDSQCVNVLVDKEILLIDSDTDFISIKRIQDAHDALSRNRSGKDFREPMAWFLDGAEEYLKSMGRWAR